MADRDYVLGTQDEEIGRLGLQQRVWRPRMLDAFRRAGIGTGSVVADVGCGPGYAAVDLAEIVGPDGRVLAFERSRRFLDSLSERAARRGLGNIEALERDVCDEGLGAPGADAAWCRWVLSFVADPARTVSHIAAALRPGGVAIFHEYADYGAWRMLPPDPDQERFRSLVVESWRDSGGEPDVGLHLPLWLTQAGLELVEYSPILEVVGRADYLWEWPRAFMIGNAARLHELGYATAEEAERFAAIADRQPEGALMMTPVVAQVIARRPSG
jgi:SAM-dependent methyltransferase